MIRHQGIPAEGIGKVVLTIGSFDGVHLGHQAVLARVREEATRAHCETVVLTFEPHPRCIVDPLNCPPALTTQDEKLELLEALGLDHAIVLSFTPQVAKQPAADFIAELQRGMTICRLVCGPDFALGHKRQGDVAWLREHGLDVVVTPPFELDGKELHSSDIRRLLGAGDIPEANRHLGRPFTLRGTVERGAQIGRAFGFPTANLAVQLNKLVPLRGVYAVRVKSLFGDHAGALNVGYRPTFGGDRLTVEVYLLDFDGDLYGTQLEAAFVARLREEEKFTSAEELAEQIARDVEQTRRILSSRQ